MNTIYKNYEIEMINQPLLTTKMRIHNCCISRKLRPAFPPQPPLFIYKRPDLYYYPIPYSELILTKLLSIPTDHRAPVSQSAEHTACIFAGNGSNAAGAYGMPQFRIEIRVCADIANRQCKHILTDTEHFRLKLLACMIFFPQ